MEEKMIKGVGLLEVIISLALSLAILTIVFTHISQSTGITRKVIANQQRNEAIFHTVDMLRSDLSKCGMRLQEAANCFSISLFEYSSSSFKVTYGIGNETLIEDSLSGDSVITINRNDFFNKGKKILLFDPEKSMYEFNRIVGRKGDELTLSEGLLYDYRKQAAVVALKEVEYKLYVQQNGNVLKRKVNRGYFQPLLEDVTDFTVRFYPEANSVFYKIEINKKEQIRGYIFMTHMMEVSQ
jgi:hypothetical protein